MYLHKCTSRSSGYIAPLIVSEFMTTKAVLYLKLVVALHDILMKTGTHRYLNEDPSKHGFF